MADFAAFGAVVRRLREQAGWTQADLARRLGVTVRTLSRLETGVQEPTWPTVLAIADQFGVSCEEFQKAPRGGIERRGRGRPAKPGPDGP